MEIKRSECFFNRTKLIKNVELKNMSGLKLQISQLAFNPVLGKYYVVTCWLYFFYTLWVLFLSVF